jgi:hypothetical protein
VVQYGNFTFGGPHEGTPLKGQGVSGARTIGLNDIICRSDRRDKGGL